MSDFAARLAARYPVARALPAEPPAPKPAEADGPKAAAPTAAGKAKFERDLPTIFKHIDRWRTKAHLRRGAAPVAALTPEERERLIGHLGAYDSMMATDLLGYKKDGTRGHTPTGLRNELLEIADAVRGNRRPPHPVSQLALNHLAAFSDPQEPIEQDFRRADQWDDFLSDLLLDWAVATRGVPEPRGKMMPGTEERLPATALRLIDRAERALRGAGPIPSYEAGLQLGIVSMVWKYWVGLPAENHVGGVQTLWRLLFGKAPREEAIEDRFKKIGAAGAAG